ncbi:hypothetical protein D3C75_1248830 [compost metagenome]
MSVYGDEVDDLLYKIEKHIASEYEQELSRISIEYIKEIDRLNEVIEAYKEILLQNS